MRRIFIVAGEESGDLHGSLLIKEIKKLSPDVEIVGMGGEKMKNAGMKSILKMDKDISVIGFGEAIRNIGKLTKIYNLLKNYLKRNKIDIFIPIDYPGMNLRLSHIAKEKGVKVIYYISPQVWAWGESRLRQIKKYVDKVIVILPFEKEFYKSKGIEVLYFGHPLLDIVKVEISEEEFRKNYKLEKPIIGLLPGSRKSEVKKNIPLLVEIAKEESKNFSFAFLRAKNIEDNNFSASFPVVSYHPYSLMKYSKLLIVTSGTATLEAAILGTPMIIIYQPSLFSYFVGKLVLKVPHIGLVNLIAGEKVFPEFVSPQIPKDKIIYEIERLTSEEENQKMRNFLSRIKKEIGKPGAPSRAAKFILTMIK